MIPLPSYPDRVTLDMTGGPRMPWRPLGLVSGIALSMHRSIVIRRAPHCPWCFGRTSLLGKYHTDCFQKAVMTDGYSPACAVERGARAGMKP